MEDSNIREFTLRGTSMLPLYRDGDKISFSIDKNYQLGDIVLFHNRGRLIGHRIVSITKMGVITKGDNNQFIDGGYYDKTDIIGTNHSMDKIKQNILEIAQKRSSFYDRISFVVDENHITDQLNALIAYYGIKKLNPEDAKQINGVRILIDSTSCHNIFTKQVQIERVVKNQHIIFFFGFPTDNPNKKAHYDYCFRVGEYGFSDLMCYQWEIPYVLSLLESICCRNKEINQ